MEKVFVIEGMHCQGCVNRINNVLSTIDGVKKYDVSLKNKTLKVKVDNEEVLNDIITKIKELDFEISQKK